jgi:hypothetical protein
MGTDDAIFQGLPGEPGFLATVTVYRLVHGEKCPFTATARMSEYMPDPPNDFDRDVLPLPECVVEDFNAPVANMLRPAFDALYQAAGSPRSPNYDEHGNWIGDELR